MIFRTFDLEYFLTNETIALTPNGSMRTIFKILIFMIMKLSDQDEIDLLQDFIG